MMLRVDVWVGFVPRVPCRVVELSSGPSGGDDCRGGGTVS